MLNINVATDFQIRSEEVLEWPPSDWRRLSKHTPVRIVYDDESKALPVMRALMAHDIEEIRMLDIDRQTYGIVMYNSSVVRLALTERGIPCFEPWIQYVSRAWALEVIGGLSNEGGA